jgi:Glycoside Hydrolase Family 113
MKGFRTVLVAAVVLGLLVAGCTAASRMKRLQPRSVPPTSPGVPAAPAPVRPAMQLGVDIDAYTYPGQDVAAAARADIAYVRSLHANAVSISFPFFMTGPAASSVYASTRTPTPAQLAVIAQTAVRAGLYVSIRPLLDEGNLGRARAKWAPRDPARWFASYQKFLLPYAAAAQRSGVSELIVGTEFTKFAASPRWNGLDAALRHGFRGTLTFASNWWGYPKTFTGNGGQGVQAGVDAYPPIPIPLAAGWTAYDRALPAGMVETEVGIAAAPGAFRSPWRHRWPGAPVDQSVQARWFSAACRAAAATHLAGIYFWSISLSNKPATGPTPGSQLSWAGGQGAQAISRCFASLQRTIGRTIGK